MIRLAASPNKFGVLNRSNEGLFQIGYTSRFRAMYQRQFCTGDDVLLILRQLVGDWNQDGSLHARELDAPVCTYRIQEHNAVLRLPAARANKLTAAAAGAAAQIRPLREHGHRAEGG